MPTQYFRFRRFSVAQDQCAMKVGTDGVLLGAWAAGGARILDAGTGTGLIALMMAQRFPDAHVDAVEIDPATAAQAADNVRSSPFAARVRCFTARLQDFVLPSPRVSRQARDVTTSEEISRRAAPDSMNGYDAVVCNPPFFTDGLRCPDSRRAMARQGDTLSYDDLASAAARLLTRQGVLSVIVPSWERVSMDSAAALAGLLPRKARAVRTAPGKIPRRILLAYSTAAGGFTEEGDMTIGDEAYNALVKDFYIDKTGQR